MAVGNEGLDKNARGKVLLLAQEIEFAKVLAGNNKRLRDRGIKRLRKWLIARSNGKCEFTDDDFLRIWKGIFYCMWMADKLLVQEELAETISSLVHCFDKADLTISFIRCFFRTMVLEWYGIDQFRYDKFMMLVRRFLRQTFKFCRSCQWQEEVVVGVCNSFSATVLSSSRGGAMSPPLSLVLHFCDIYLQELAKVGKEKIPVKIVTAFLQPFIRLMTVEENGLVRTKVMRDVFDYLMKQSDAALEFTEKWQAWQSAGCPGDSWEDMERVEEEEDGMECEDLDPSEREMLSNEPLDPRAGSVDVELSQIPFDCQDIAEAIQLEIETCASDKYSKALQYLAKKFMELSEGKYPLAKIEEKNMLTDQKIGRFRLKTHIEKAVYRLNDFERNQGKRKRKRKGRKKIDKQKKIFEETAEVGACNDTDRDNASCSLPPVVGSPEKISNQSRTLLDDCVKETNDDTGAPLKHNSRKRSLSSWSVQDGDISKLKAEVIDEVKTNSMPPNKKRAVSGSWQVSDMAENRSENKSIEKTPLLPSGSVEVESIAQASKLTTPSNSKVNRKATELGSSKKVNIALSKNSIQDLRQYQMAVKRSPAIPFDGSKQPSQGVLKPSPIGTRINPFYRM